MADDTKRARIVEARLKLRERLLDRMQRTPGLSDSEPLGSGPPNRHGMPRLPIGQYETTKWPVLDLGVKPDVSRDAWRLVVDGACRRPLELTWDDLMDLGPVDDTSDFHCVTTWSRFDLRWRGVRVADVIALADPAGDADYIMCHAYDGYTTNVPLVEAIKPDVLLAFEVDGEPLPREHGGPVRMVTPQLYAWKGAKWIRRIELMVEDRPGFWEERGYSMTAHPWRNDRYR
ncbi:MAG: sulfite oxidase-like oxidoreductase [Deltaproteobacteria bacterium]|nr:MAG: sulfite oxidase-like oxidoreductase [Deltaproteobacteria bacterium]